MSKKILRSAISVSLILTMIFSALPVTAASGGTGAELYENTQELMPGFFYKNTVSINASGKRVETYSLETTPDGPVYPIVMAKDMIYSQMDINDMIAWAEGQGLNVHGAINADFFYGSMSFPLGGVIMDGRYISSTNNENLLAFDADGAFFLEKPAVELTLEKHGGVTVDPETGVETAVPGDIVRVSHLNKIRTKTGGLFLYTPAYHSTSTNTSRRGWAVRFKVLEGELTVSGSVELQVDEVIPDGVDFALGDGYMVLTAPADNPTYADLYKKFSVGETVTLTATCSDERLAGAKWATGCGDILVSGGVMTDPNGWDKDLLKPNPRTAIGIKPDGSMIAYAVDGRSGSYSNGALLEELATDLIARGCVTVVNLDGGGSTVMSVRLPGSSACGIVNRPSSGSSRKCSTYILFVSDTRPDGAAASLHVLEDGAYVMTGSTLPVDIIATDAAGSPAELTDAVTVTSQLGTYENGIYTAGGTAGVDRLELTCPDTGAVGVGYIHIIDKLDTLTVTDAATGKAPSLTSLERDYEAQLMVAGTYLGRDVAIDNVSARFDLSEGLGEVTPEGRLILSARSGQQGELNVTAGNVSQSFPVGVKLRFDDIEGHWAEKYISSLYDSGVVNGTGDGLFKPDDTISRCDFTLMLWRALGSPVLEPEVPEEPEDTLEPDDTAEPGNAEEPGEQEEIEAPEEPDAPSQSETPEEPDAPSQSETPKEPDAPDTGDAHGEATGGDDAGGAEGSVKTSPFTDVDPEAYYFDAVVWADMIGLSNGVGDGKFDPLGRLTREQAFTMVYRLLTTLRKELPEPDPAALEVFSDTADIDAFALEAMESLTTYGMISGDGGMCFPLRDTTRGEMAKILIAALYDAPAE